MKHLHENFAAIAVMGELYGAGKDIYDVLAAYLQIIIQTENLKTFSSAEITEKINKSNSFKVSESVVRTSLKRLGFKREQGLYVRTKDFQNTFDEQELLKQKNENKTITESLFKFISQEKGCGLKDSEKMDIENQFYRYITDPELESKYSMLISKFLMDNYFNPGFQESIERIKEGLLVYEGICFSPELGTSGKWDISLNIFLELEVLFFITGYNGEIHQEIYSQLIDYVNEVNLISESKTGRLISLYYTKDIKDEIENYFSTAEYIFDKNEIVDPSKKAMIYILDGVKSKRDIQTKKLQFYGMLTQKGIKEFNIDFYSEENRKYNTIAEDTYQYNYTHLESDKGEEYIKNCTDKINQINILRKNKNTSLKEAKNILLTANGTILRCAYMPSAYKEGDTPKAVNLDYLVNRLWYKLNKGFGKGKAPKSMDIISRAQMVIASMTGSKVSQAYEDIKLKYSEGSITDVEVAGLLSELRKISKNPEDITVEQIDEQILFLSDYELNSKLEDIKREELARIKDKEKIKSLEKQLDDEKRQRKIDEQNRQKKEKMLEKRIASLEKQNSETETSNQELRTIIQSYVDDRRKIMLLGKKIFRVLVLLILVTFVGAVLYALLKFIFQLDKSISGIVSIAFTAVSQFLPVMKKIWKKYVADCKLKE